MADDYKVTRIYTEVHYVKVKR